MTAATAARLYDEDFFLWTQEQSRLLRDAAERRLNFPLDWDNLAEEIESLGKSQRSELRDRLTTIVEHLLKLEYSVARDPRRGWEDTVMRSRVAIDGLLQDNPSLRREIPALSQTVFERYAKFSINDLIRRGELEKSRRHEILARRYTEEELLEHWYPGEEPAPP
jgi:hypothetical protein